MTILGSLHSTAIIRQTQLTCRNRALFLHAQGTPKQGPTTTTTTTTTAAAAAAAAAATAAAAAATAAAAAALFLSHSLFTTRLAH